MGNGVELIGFMIETAERSGEVDEEWNDFSII
jgi:hypothetical protein